MSRPLRVAFAGAAYLVSARGAGAAPIFRSDEDRKRFLGILESAADRYHLLCHAYCLMDDRYFLLLETPEGSLSRAMRQLNGVYGQYVCRQRGRPGPVLDGRFRSQLVEKDAWLLELARYVVLVPARAGLVTDPAKWHWSSYRATAGEAPVPGFLAAGWLLSLVGGDTVAEARRKYRSFIRKGLEEGTGTPAGLGRAPILGTAAFAESLRPFLHDSARAIAVRKRRAVRPPLENLLHESLPRDVRNARILEAYRRHGYTMQAIADRLRLHYSTVSRIVTAAERGES
jgi:REP element-mobilizing transposase RayT